MRTKWMVLPLALLATACSEELSGQIETNKISARYSVTAYTKTVRGGEAYEAAAHFFTHGGVVASSVRLENEQVFVVADAREPLLMPRNSSGFYDVDLPVPVREVRFELRRKEDKASALDTRVPVPLPLEFEKEPEQVGYGDNLELSWSNPIADYRSEIKLSPSPCGGASSIVLGPFPDTGSLSIKASELLVGEADAAGECLSISVDRTVHGVVDPALDRTSVVEGIRYQSLQLTVTP